MASSFPNREKARTGGGQKKSRPARAPRCSTCAYWGTKGECRMEKTQVTAGIVAYGGAQEVLAAARSLAEHTQGVDLRLMVLDNASPDGAGKELASAELPQNVRVECSKANLGFGKGHNRIFRRLAAESPSRYHAVVNPDITVDADVLTALCRWMDEHPDVAMVTPRLLFPDGREQYTAKRFPSLLALLSRQVPLPFLKGVERHYLMLDEDLSKPTDVQFCSGCFFVMRSEVYKAMGGFDERYFVYVEDADITRQALGYGRAVYLPEVSVYHAWHRDANRRMKNFWMQIHSMLRYWGKWGFKLR